MKKLLKKSWFTGILIIILLLTAFFINFGIMSLNLDWPFASENFLLLLKSPFEDGTEYIFAFILVLVFYTSIISILLSIISIFRKKNFGLIIAGLHFLGLNIALIAFQSVTEYLPLKASVLNIVNILLVMFIFTIVIIRNRTLDIKENNKDNDVSNKLSNSKIPLMVLIVNIIAIGIYLSTFLIPIYTRVKPGLDYSAVMINVILSGETNYIPIISFFVNFAIFMFVFLYFADSLSNFIVNKERFMRQSKKLVIFTFIATALFFLAGLVIDIVYTILHNMNITTISYIPMALMLFVIFVYSILLGKYQDYKQVISDDKPKKHSKIEPLFYIIILTAITVLLLFIPIFKIDISSGLYQYQIHLTGINILRDYPNLEIGYRVAAYMLLVMLISIAFCLIVSFASCLSKSKLFTPIIKFTTGVNIFFVFIFAISGYYFQIAREINKAIIADMAEFYGFNIPNAANLDYVISTDAIYVFIGAAFILIIMFMRKVFDRDEFLLLENGLLEMNSSANNNESLENDNSFDPCYSFTELDSKIDLFSNELTKRKTLRQHDVSLNGLVNFIVEYAKNSRLHLSYTQEDIATFVAGLGACKLSILQGMSGTGKTSLPKIFSEAICGNCDIIEVESSWKDKNELLGYYNEFSMKYTPKKFTLALYKAALNPDVFTFILLDEMNLSRIEYYFSDFLSLMENEEQDREIKLINIKLSRNEEGEEIDYIALENGHTLRIPPNVWFIGTANRDESTFVISDKVYDRAHTMNFTKRAPKVTSYSNPIPKQYYDYHTMNRLFAEAKTKGQFDAEECTLIKNIEGLLSPYNISFGNRILNQIEDFVNIYNECFLDEDVESIAVEKILLSKVVTKLEVKTIEDKEKLEMEFEKLGLYKCAEFIKHLDED